ncbi:MAG: hypothetical protein CME65_10990 [Halobacteriovoraceae bacterium]|nr:hypothetical protein [Halobacteriovoraceae bacterium]|tara:strand:+ start:1682 stop:2707 length:1026 start_codon:yes stop_codon:yes gene_type:complete
MPRLNLAFLALLTLSANSFADTGEGIDLTETKRSFPISEKVVEDEFFGTERFYALETEILSVKTSNSSFFSSAALRYGLDIKADSGSKNFSNQTGVSAYFNALSTLKVLDENLDYKFPSQLKIVIDRYTETPWAVDAGRMQVSEAGYIRNEGLIAFSPASENSTSLAKSIDIVAHEIAHAVVANTSQLDTSIGSKLINEAFADIIGVYVESKLNDSGWNWKIGEASYHDQLSCHRDIHDPEDPILLRHTSNVTEDDGIYVLSGIVTTSFYYLATGEDLHGVEILPKSNMDTLVKLYFDVVTKDLSSSVKVKDLKEALIERAKLQAPELEQRILRAFELVGM